MKAEDGAQENSGAAGPGNGACLPISLESIMCGCCPCGPQRQPYSRVKEKESRGGGLVEAAKSRSWGRTLSVPEGVQGGPCLHEGEESAKSFCEGLEKTDKACLHVTGNKQKSVGHM